MNINQWPLGQIMQLPDHVFGQKWIVACELSQQTGSETWDISEIAFPEVAVFWQIGLYTYNKSTTPIDFTVALGDQLPMSLAMINSLEPLVPGLGLQGAEPRDIMNPHEAGQCVMDCKYVRQTAGRRLVLGMDTITLQYATVRVWVVCSSIPKEVPDCLLSDLVKSL